MLESNFHPRIKLYFLPFVPDPYDATSFRHKLKFNLYELKTTPKNKMLWFSDTLQL